MSIALLDNVLFLVGISIEMYMIFTHRIAKGKLISVRMRNRLVRRSIEKKNLFTLMVASSPPLFRFGYQMGWVLILCVLNVPYSITPDSSGVVVNLVGIVNWIVVIVLFGDDWLTNTDKPKKLWNSVKNKVKWKLVPAPVPVRA